MRTILGIDPGLRQTGWGLIQAKGNELRFISCGTIKTNDKESLCKRLSTLSEGLKGVITEHDPDEVAAEEMFANKNGATTIKLAQARGSLIVTAANVGLQVAEYTPSLVKKSIVGTGAANKDQMIMMVKTLLPQSNPENDHEADALAVAITHANHAAINF